MSKKHKEFRDIISKVRYVPEPFVSKSLIDLDITCKLGKVSNGMSTSGIMLDRYLNVKDTIYDTAEPTYDITEYIKQIKKKKI